MFLRVRRQALWSSILAASAILLLAALRGIAHAAGDADNPCLVHTQAVERRAAMPAGLLSAMAHVESGRWRPELRVRQPWPWTLRAGARFWYLPSRAAALDTLRTLKEQGVESVDVGCMQINLRYHPDAFASLEDALDPAANVGYAATFLRDLKDETGSWQLAAGYYHSRDPDRSKAYLATVEQEWRRPPVPAAKASVPFLTRATVRELRALCDQMLASLARLRTAFRRSAAPVVTVRPPVDPTFASDFKVVLYH